MNQFIIAEYLEYRKASLLSGIQPMGFIAWVNMTYYYETFDAIDY